MRIALAQINTTVGDFEGNLDKLRDAAERARDEGADLVVFPEQTLPGYPAEDLLERADFVESAERAFASVLELSREIDVPMIVGTLTPTSLEIGKSLYNSASVVHGGKLLGRQHKTLLPTYDVFDEARYFEPANEHCVFDLDGTRVGVAICEDIWNDATFWARRLYAVDPVEELVSRGAEILVVISASPFSLGRRVLRRRMLENIARRRGVGVVFVNLVGGNTTLVFDGHSLVFDRDARLLCECAGFEEDFRVIDLEKSPPVVAEAGDESAECHRALVLGTRDYLLKTGFTKAVIGLSGGIDSSLTAVVAAEAVGPENVIGVAMPTRYSSEGSVTDAETLARTLGIEYHLVPAENIFAAALDSLSGVFAGLEPDVTEENLQARARGLILMAMSNKFGALLLTTGNKSEIAVGYCTLYGDMCGGLAVISDVPKTLVYRISRYINRSREIIPLSVLEKPPSAELRPDQKDEDSLPPYSVLDAILEAYIEQQRSLAEIARDGISRRTVDEVVALVQRTEYKRQQAAPGIRISTKAFGPGRRYPIVQRFRHD